MNKLILTLSSCAVILTARAQQGNFYTAADYSHAESMMAYNTNQLIDHGNVNPNWMAGDKFWYRDLTADGSEFVLVDPAKRSRKAAFDHERLAAALSTATGKAYSAYKLPFMLISFSTDFKFVVFDVDGKQWKCDLKTYQISASDNIATSSPVKGETLRGRFNFRNEVPSPDGKMEAFIKNYNLWVRDIKTKTETQLTTDGEKDFGYATDNAGWTSSDRAILLWSPDSKKIATNKQDERKVGDMYLVPTVVGHSKLKAWKYPLPGDKDIAMVTRVIIDVDKAKVTKLQMLPDAHRSTFSDDFSTEDMNWSEDGTHLAFISTSRDHKNEKVRIADAVTGEVREVFEETSATQYESGWGGANWKYLPKTNEIIWFSERDNWGHLYLYDATTGKLKNQITKGDWVVTHIVKVDDKKREIYFMADGREAENPYFSQFCKVGFDDKNVRVLTPEDGTHQVSISPSGAYFMDTYSKPDVPPTTVMRSIAGKLLVTVGKTDVSRLAATGWKPAMPFSVKAGDGKTDIYGLMFVPSHLDPSKKYPVIDYIYPGPQGGSVGSWAFAAVRGDNQALAELGFVVVEIEGTSNPLRSKSFHDMSYGDMSTNTLADQVSGIQQLAQRYSYMDINKVGIWGHSGGGFATAAAMFRYPDFFKVGISESGNHDNRNYEDDWGERYDGLLTTSADGTSNYTNQANEFYAKNLKGKLMLAHGLMDNNVPPQNTLLVIEALEKANKNYDLVVFPNSAHGYGQYSPYMMRRRWDYFVKNLLGIEPPVDYQLKSSTDPRNNVGK